MKKQILLLTFLSLAFVFAGVNNAYGQQLTDEPVYCVEPEEITCITASGPLNPIPGTPYDYEVDVPSPTGDKTYNWFVTTDKTFIDPADGLTTNISAIGDAYIAAVNTGAGGTYNNDGNGGTESINITWQSFTHDEENPVFLVIYVENTDECTVDNLEAFIIEPQHSFTLDIDNIMADGTQWTGTASDCVSPIVSAEYDGTEINMDYGENYIYFVVNAANFVNSWMPTFELTGVNTTGSATQTVDWAYPSESHGTATWHSTSTTDSVIYTTADAVNAVDNSGSVGEDGECIIVRVHIDHNQDETITEQNVTLAVDGIMYDPTAPDGDEYASTDFGDIHHTDGCTQDGYTNDRATHILTPRPDINTVAPDPFVDKERD